MFFSFSVLQELENSDSDGGEGDGDDDENDVSANDRSYVEDTSFLKVRRRREVEN